MHSSVDLRAGHYQDGAIVEIAGDPCRAGQFESFRGVDVARYVAMNDGGGHVDISSHHALLTDRQQRSRLGGNDLAVDAPIEEQGAGEADVTGHAGALSDQAGGDIGMV